MHRKGNYKGGKKTTFIREKITTNETTDKGLISQKIQATHTIPEKQSIKWEKDQNRHFSKEDI